MEGVQWEYRPPHQGWSTSVQDKHHRKAAGYASSNNDIQVLHSYELTRPKYRFVWVETKDPKLDDLHSTVLAGPQNFLRCRNTLVLGIFAQGEVDLKFDGCQLFENSEQRDVRIRDPVLEMGGRSIVD